jgi:hypothetical protein
MVKKFTNIFAGQFRAGMTPPSKKFGRLALQHYL